jgi:C-terminal processing protease CtpA/Prc
MALLLTLPVLPHVTGQTNEDATPGKDKDRAKSFSQEVLLAIKKIDEEHVAPAPQPQMLRWAIQGLYRAVKQPLPNKINQRLARLDKATKQEMQQLLHDVRAALGSRRELADDRDFRICMKEIFAQLEPAAEIEMRSCYYGPEVERRLGIGGWRPPTSVGLKMDTDPATGFLRVVTPIRNSPADKAGVRPGDLITRIEIDTDKFGQVLPQPKVFSTKGMSVERAQQLFLGQAGTRVKLTVRRPN